MNDQRNALPIITGICGLAIIMRLRIFLVNILLVLSASAWTSEAGDLNDSVLGDDSGLLKGIKYVGVYSTIESPAGDKSKLANTSDFTTKVITKILETNGIKIIDETGKNAGDHKADGAIISAKLLSITNTEASIFYIEISVQRQVKTLDGLTGTAIVYQYSTFGSKDVFDKALAHLLVLLKKPLTP